MVQQPEPLADEARETAGVTSALLLAYLERVGGQEAIDEVLRRCGLEGCESALRDESCWFSFETKIALFEASAAVLDDPDFLDGMAAMALDLNVAGALKVALRTLGTPQFVYRNIVRANARFNGSHQMEMLAVGDGHARIAFREIGGGRRFHPLDCRYTQALLPIVPRLFGLPDARVSHGECMADGADACVYDLTWSQHRGVAGAAVRATLAAAAACGAAALALPVALPAAAAGSALLGGLVARSAWRARRDRWRHLEQQANDDVNLAQQLIESLQDLVSELDLEELLEKVTLNAKRAVGGREFALLLREGETIRCHTSSGVPKASVSALEAWVESTPRALEQALVIDDVASVVALAGLPAEPSMPLRSLTCAPLVSHGEGFGVLVALGRIEQTFLPRELEIVRSFAAQVAIALSNARRYSAEQSLAARDPLTGLLNHRRFHEAVGGEIAARSVDDRLSSLVMIDLDGFKRINDEDGHAAGDEFLRAAALALGEACRHEDLAFRVGGDEFALLLPCVDAHAAETVAGRACAAVGRLDPRTGASYGIAPITGASSRDDALNLADRRLYAAKRAAAPHRDRGVTTADRGVAMAVAVLEAAVAAHDGSTAAHAVEVAELSERVARRLGLDAAAQHEARDAARLHDVGKLAISTELLRKPDALTSDEWDLVRSHSDHGARILLAAPELASLAEVVRNCHERWDGTGYPAGRRGAEIPLPARIVAVCDAYEAMVAHRPYCPRRSPADAVRELQRCAGTQFD
ncbi:MAG: hypothetical protein QOF12_993, partial [Solirubrobacteraceae bacterium]|nr:hypothetical protein [Solirubrobacteraceae bacterium]